MTFAELRRAVEEADRLFNEGDWPTAFRHYGRILRSYLEERGVDANAVAIAERYADLAITLGLPDAGETLEAVADLASVAGDTPAAVTLLLKQIHVAVGAGELARADAIWSKLDAWERAIGAAHPARPRLLAHRDLEWGRTCAAHGHYREAIVAYEQGLARAAGIPGAEARTLDLALRLSLAEARLEVGELDACARALEGLNADECSEAGFLIRRLEIQAKAEALRGRFGDSLACLARVVRLCHARGLRRAMAQALLNLASLEISLMQTQEARESLADARAVAPDDPGLSQRAWFLETLAAARDHTVFEREPLALPATVLQGAASPAAHSRIVEEEIRSVESRLDLAHCERSEIEILVFLHRGWVDRASAYLELARGDFALTDSPLIRARLDALDGIVSFYRTDYPRARDLLRGAEQAFLATGCLPDLYQTRRFLSFCARAVGDHEESRRLGRDNDALLKTIAASLSPRARAIYLLNKWAAMDRELDEQLKPLRELKAQLAEGLAFVPRIRARWRYWKLLSAFIDRAYQLRTEAAAEQAAPEQAGPVSARPVAPWRRLFLHPWRDHTEGYVQLPNSLVSFELRWMHLDFEEHPVTRAHIDGQVRDFHSGAASGAPATDWDLVTRIASTVGLVKTIERLPAWIRSLTIIPDGALHHLPFPAVRVGGQYVIYRRAVTVRLDAAPARPAARKGQLAVVVGLNHIGPGWRDLKHAEEEARAVGAWLGRHGLVTVGLLGDRATKPALLNALESARFLSFSGHGELRPDAPQRSGIILRGPETLDFEQLARLRLPGLEHVTLAACWSADSLQFPGRWIVSLPQLFLTSGARSVLASLWEVDDEVAKRVHLRFLQGLRRHSRAVALQRAQLAEAAADPYQWACLQLYGEGGRLRL